ncbi:MAG TPA: hypothetical protein VJQ47_08335 [Steroidobacteraceae bacterium]|nr:hypothetical protein [Steroidobacteraceae bacterium]
MHIDSLGRLNNDQEQSLAMTCPHCEVVSRITPGAVPRFEDLQAHKPRQIGVVYRCDACLSPIFLRFTVRLYGATRIELASQFTEVERPREKFTFTYLPSEVELLFKEALACFTAGAFNGFASMCRRTAQAAFCDLGETGKLQVFDELNMVRTLADLPQEVFVKLKGILFGSETDPRSQLALLDSYEAGIVLEVMKDLLYEAYVRKGKLRQAMSVRRFLLDETATNITPLASRPAS